MYDIYLTRGCGKFPHTEDLVEEVPELASSALQGKLLALSPPRPGFLGLDLLEQMAIKLLLRLMIDGAVGQIVPAAYREPRISQEQARVLAEPAITELHAIRYPEHELGEIYYRGDWPEAWVFGAFLEPTLEREGAGPYVGVDKVDGHIWTAEDFARREKRSEMIEEAFLKLKKE